MPYLSPGSLHSFSSSSSLSSLPHSRCTAFTLLKPGALLPSSSYLCLCPSPHTGCPSFPSRIWHSLFPSSPLVPSYSLLTDALYSLPNEVQFPSPSHLVPSLPILTSLSFFPFLTTGALSFPPSCTLVALLFLSFKLVPCFPLPHTCCKFFLLHHTGALLSTSSHMVLFISSLRCPISPISHTWCLCHSSSSSYLVPSFPFLTPGSLFPLSHTGAILSLSSHQVPFFTSGTSLPAHSRFPYTCFPLFPFSHLSPFYLFVKMMLFQTAGVLLSPSSHQVSFFPLPHT